MNPFIPQVGQYNAVEDITGAFLRDYQMRLQRESQVMGLMKQLDPVQLSNDYSRMEQYKQIKGVEDYVTGLMKQKKGRLSSEDLFDIQYRISEVERWQEDSIMNTKMFERDMNLSRSNPEKFEIDGVKEFNWITKGIAPADGTYVKELFPNIDEMLSTYQPIQQASTYTDIVETNPETGAYTSVTKSRWGADDETNPNGQWINQRRSLLSNNLINNREWAGAAKNGYANQPPEVRAKYDEIDRVQKQTPSEEKKLADGTYVTDKLGGWYYWMMDRADEIQPTTQSGKETFSSTVKKKTTPETTTTSGVTVDAEGDAAQYQISQQFSPKGEPVLVTFAPEKREKSNDIVGGGAKAKRLNVNNDMVIADEDLFGVSVADANNPGVKAEKGYTLTQPAIVERGHEVYTGNDVLLDKIANEKLGYGGRQLFLTEGGSKAKTGVKLYYGMPISKELKARLEEMKTDPKVAEALGMITKGDIIKWSVLWGSAVKGETRTLSQMLTPELAKEWGFDFVDYGQTAEEPEKVTKPDPLGIR